MKGILWVFLVVSTPSFAVTLFCQTAEDSRGFVIQTEHIRTYPKLTATFGKAPGFGTARVFTAAPARSVRDFVAFSSLSDGRPEALKVVWTEELRAGTMQVGDYSVTPTGPGRTDVKMVIHKHRAYRFTCTESGAI